TPGPFLPPRCRSASTSFLILLIFVLRSDWSFSEDLCFGISLSITCSAASSSSGVVARRYSSSALRYWGVRLAAMAAVTEKDPIRHFALWVDHIAFCIGRVHPFRNAK